MEPRDTTASARQVQIEIWRSMTGEQRSAMAMALSDDMRDVARAGIRQRHPDYDDDDVEHALHRLLVGDDLADRAWPEQRHLVP